jgi:hypothetical protein
VSANKFLANNLLTFKAKIDITEKIVSVHPESPDFTKEILQTPVKKSSLQGFCR